MNSASPTTPDATIGQDIHQLLRIRQYYNQFYHYLQKDLTQPNPRHAKVQESLKPWVRPGMWALDLGCGLGITTHFLRQSGCHAVGVDLSDRLVCEARRHFGGDFLCADLCRLHLKKRFDLVTLVDCLEHLPPARRPLAWEVIRAHLKPGGLLYLNFPAPAFQEWNRRGRVQALQLVDEVVPLAEVVQALQDHNFTLLFLKTYGLDVPEQYVEVLARYAFPEDLKESMWGKLRNLKEDRTEPPRPFPACSSGRTPIRPRVGFFAGDAGNFHFVRDLAACLEERDFEVRLFPEATHNPEKLAETLKWCQVAWFEWANGPIIPATQLPKSCRIICRLHRYEVYSDTPAQINWDKVDDLIFVSPGVLETFKQRLDPAIEARVRVHVIPNLVNPRRFPFLGQRPKGFDLAWVGRLHPDKNPALVLQIMAALVKADRRYRCYLIGREQDPVLAQYLQAMIRELDLEEHLSCQGQVREVAAWLRDKHYLLNTSVVEGHPVALMEAMLLGLKPIIHNFCGGAKELFPPELVYSTVAEAVELILSDDYRPSAYRRFIEERYPFEKLLAECLAVIADKCGFPFRFSKEAHSVNSAQEAAVNNHTSSGPSEAEPGAEVLISVIVPTYNRAGFLAQALASVLSQEADHLEVLVVDDGSTDETAEVVSRIDDPRLRYLRKPKTNAPDTRNWGIAHARGRWLLWLDSDDLLMPGWLARLQAVLAESPAADVYYGNLTVVDTQGNPLQSLRYEDFADRPDLLLARLLRANPLPLPGSLVRRSLLQEVGGFDVSFPRAHDYELWTRLAPRARFRHVNFLAARWRWHHGNMSSGSVARDLSYEAEIVKRLLKRHPLKAFFPDLDWASDWRTAQARAAREIGEILARYGDHEGARDWFQESAALQDMGLPMPEEAVHA